MGSVLSQQRPREMDAVSSAAGPNEHPGHHLGPLRSASTFYTAKPAATGAAVYSDSATRPPAVSGLLLPIQPASRVAAPRLRAPAASGGGSDLARLMSMDTKSLYSRHF